MGCADGFEGPTCEREGECACFDVCSSSPCANGGQCLYAFGDYECECAEGFTGRNCDVSADGAECESNGCSSLPCRNGGTCYGIVPEEGSDDVAEVACVCPAGFSGPLCEVRDHPCDPSPCENGALCFERSSSDGNDGLPSYFCRCTSGYQGATCSVPSDPCAANPCRHGGTCLTGRKSAGEGAYFCACADGYAGHDCGRTDDDVCGCDDVCAPNPCKNGGECLAQGATGKFVCLCIGGTYGTTCEYGLEGVCPDACAADPCANGAACLSDHDGGGFLCVCPVSFDGPRCSLAAASVSIHFTFPVVGVIRDAAAKLATRYNVAASSLCAEQCLDYTDANGGVCRAFSYSVALSRCVLFSDETAPLTNDSKYQFFERLL